MRRRVSILALIVLLGVTADVSPHKFALGASADPRTAPEANGGPFRRYYAGARLLENGARSFRAARYAKAIEDWETFLSLSLAWIPPDVKGNVAVVPFAIRTANATSLFGKLHRYYEDGGDQRPPGTPQIPRRLADAFSAAEMGKYQNARCVLLQAAVESPKLHRIPFVLALLDILAGNENGAASYFLKLTALPPEVVSPDIVAFSQEQISAVHWLVDLARRRTRPANDKLGVDFEILK